MYLSIYLSIYSILFYSILFYLFYLSEIVCTIYT